MEFLSFLEGTPRPWLCKCTKILRIWNYLCFSFLCWRKIPSSRIKYSYFHRREWSCQQGLVTLAIGSRGYCGMWQTHHMHPYVPTHEGSCPHSLPVSLLPWALLSILNTPVVQLTWNQSFQVLLAPICFLSLFPFCTKWKCSRCSTDSEESQEAVIGNTVFSPSLETEAQKVLSSVSCCSETCYRKM